MSVEFAVSRRGSTSSRWAEPRRRLVIDPIWKVVDAGVYNHAWNTLNKEAKLYGFVGFDMEWTTKMAAQDDEDGEGKGVKPSTSSSKRKPRRWTGPVATIQLSTFSFTIVIRWNHLHALVSGNASDVLSDPYASISSKWPGYRIGQKTNPPSLLRKVYTDVKGLIASPSIFLVGVGIHGDEVKLHRDYPKITAESAVELTALAEACLPDLIPDKSRISFDFDTPRVRTDSLQSLKKLCEALTGKELGKDMSVVMSDWGGCHGALTPLQIEYSAEDAEASYEVCAAILEGGGFLNRLVSDGNSEEEHTNAAPWKVAKDFDCREVLSCCTTAFGRKASDESPASEFFATQEQPAAAKSNLLSAAAAENDEGKTEAGWCKGRLKPYYDNICVYSPDMHLVFTVDRAKADWYVNKKGLATVVEWRPANATASPGMTSEQEMAAIQLKFAPDFARYNDAHIRRNMDYFKQPKENICVVCGRGGSLVRFAVVPLMYRRFFPSVYMSHNSYDLLLLCSNCFAKSRRLYNQLRLDVAEDFGIPLVLLRGEQREAYAERVRRVEQEIEALSCVYEGQDSDRNAERQDGTEKDCDIHPRVKLQGMLDYVVLMEHREVLDKVFSYAKALHAHYQSLALAHKEASPACDGDDGVVETPPASFPSNSGKRSGKRRDRAASAACTAIPEARRSMMADFLRANAPLYPFYAECEQTCANREPSEGSGRRFDGQAAQDAIFGADGDGAASFSGVQLILTGCVNVQDDNQHLTSHASPSRANTSRGVLTRYWVKMHPELLATLPAVTRVEERQRELGSRDDADCAGDDGRGTGVESRGGPPADALTDSDASGLPFVDSHAFLVLQLLLKKYERRADGQKTGEHAVGQFIYRWRSSFVGGMRPQHLPIGWEPEDGILR